MARRPASAGRAALPGPRSLNPPTDQPTARPPLRRGVGAIFFAVMLVGLMGVWATSQHLVVSNVRHRIRLAEAERATLRAALMLAEQGPLYFTVASSGDDDPTREAADLSLATRVRRLVPGEVLQTDDLPWLWDKDLLEYPVAVAETRMIAYLLESETPPSAFAVECPCQAARDTIRNGKRSEGGAALRAGPRPKAPSNDGPTERELAALVDCGAYRDYLENYADLPGNDPDRARVATQVLGDYQAVALRGVVEFHAITRAYVGLLPVYARVRLRYQFGMQSSPCPDVEADREAAGFGSSVRLVPVELGRILETWRGNDGPP